MSRYYQELTKEASRFNIRQNVKKGLEKAKELVREGLEKRIPVAKNQLPPPTKSPSSELADEIVQGAKAVNKAEQEVAHKVAPPSAASPNVEVPAAAKERKPWQFKKKQEYAAQSAAPEATQEVVQEVVKRPPVRKVIRKEPERVLGAPREPRQLRLNLAPGEGAVSHTRQPIFDTPPTLTSTAKSPSIIPKDYRGSEDKLLAIQGRESAGLSPLSVKDLRKGEGDLHQELLQKRFGPKSEPPKEVVLPSPKPKLTDPNLEPVSEKVLPLPRESPGTLEMTAPTTGRRSTTTMEMASPEQGRRSMDTMELSSAAKPDRVLVSPEGVNPLPPSTASKATEKAVEKSEGGKGLHWGWTAGAGAAGLGLGAGATLPIAYGAGKRKERRVLAQPQ